MKPVVTDQSFDDWLKDLHLLPSPVPLVIEVGRVVEVADGIAVVSDLKHALADELLIFASGVHGLVLDLEPGRLGVIYWDLVSKFAWARSVSQPEVARYPWASPVRTSG